MNLTVKEKTHVLIALKNIKDKALESDLSLPDYGICVHLMLEISNLKKGVIVKISSINLVAEYSKGWEHHSGLLYNPLNDKGELLWEGENLKMRIDLIDYICDRLERELNT